MADGALGRGEPNVRENAKPVQKNFAERALRPRAYSQGRGRDQSAQGGVLGDHADCLSKTLETLSDPEVKKWAVIVNWLVRCRRRFKSCDVRINCGQPEEPNDR